MARTSTSFALLLLLMSGCGAPGGQGNTTEPPAANASLQGQPVKEEHRAAALSAAWLAGRWQTGDGDCAAGDTFLTFAPDGRYGYMSEAGRWTLEGNRLTIEITDPAEDGGAKAGDRHTNEVRAIGPNEAEFRTAGADPIRVFRCHGG